MQVITYHVWEQIENEDRWHEIQIYFSNKASFGNRVNTIDRPFIIESLCFYIVYSLRHGGKVMRKKFPRKKLRRIQKALFISRFSLRVTGIYSIKSCQGTSIWGSAEKASPTQGGGHTVTQRISILCQVEVVNHRHLITNDYTNLVCVFSQNIQIYAHITMQLFFVAQECYHLPMRIILTKCPTRRKR